VSAVFFFVSWCCHYNSRLTVSLGELWAPAGLQPFHPILPLLASPPFWNLQTVRASSPFSRPWLSFAFILPPFFFLLRKMVDDLCLCQFNPRSFIDVRSLPFDISFSASRCAWPSKPMARFLFFCFCHSFSRLDPFSFAFFFLRIVPTPEQSNRSPAQESKHHPLSSLPLLLCRPPSPLSVLLCDPGKVW